MSKPDALTGSGVGGLADRMGESAGTFIAALAPDQRAKAVFSFADETERTRWFYTPNPRGGLPLAEMDPRQRRLAHQLAATGVSRAGYVAAVSIIGLERTLDATEGWRAAPGFRDPALYYVSIFGDPSPRDTWGWRFEGHHLSLNYTIANGRVVSPTPAFFGANPAEAPLGAGDVLRPLGPVERLGRDLIHLLPSERRAVAIISPAAPTDIVISNRALVVDGALPIPPPQMMGVPMTADWEERLRTFEDQLGFTATHAEAVRYTVQPKGLAASAMNAAERQALTELLRAYIHRMPDELAEIELAHLDHVELDHLHFAWAGGIERRQPHYYRIQGPRVLVEYDNSQDDANHIHSVWRDPLNDFGANMLAQHYARAHS